MKKMKRLLCIIMTMLFFATVLHFTVKVANAAENDFQTITVTGRSVTFSYPVNDGEREITSLWVKGTFNGWNNLPLQKDGEVWKVTVDNLTAGTYEYGFVANDLSSGWIGDKYNTLPKAGNGNPQFAIAGLSSIDPFDPLVVIGEEKQLKAVGVKEDLTTGAITDGVIWTVSENSRDIVEISDKGVVTAKISSIPEGKAYVNAEVIAEVNGGKVSKKLYVVKEKIVSPVINGDGTATFNVPYNGDKLYLVGDINGWDNKGIEMKKVAEGLFTHTMAITPGRHLYKFLPTSGSWDGEFPDPLNPERDGINSVLVMPSPCEVQIKYIRKDGDYTDWNLWVWSTGVKDGRIDFSEIMDGAAIAHIAVTPTTRSIGFKVRKGEDWKIVDVDVDRNINIAEGAQVTKAIVKEGELDIYTLPTITGPVLRGGKAIFYYRDLQLFREGKMDNIKSVKLLIDGKTLDMVYDDKDELFKYEYSLNEGITEYKFEVTTADGNRKVITDPANTMDGKSIIEYRKPSLAVSATVTPDSVDYNDNAVVKVNVETAEDIKFQEVYVDLTNVGGPEKVNVDLELMALTIGVKDTTTAGDKTIPVIAVDQYGNEYKASVKLTVKTRQSVGKDDFDWDEARIYFIVTDRFNNGDTSNDDPNGENYNKKHLESYHGGDIKGITEKLDYLKELGINTIWITPIVDNIDFNVAVNWNVPEELKSQYGYHGYWAKNFEAMDEHLGSVEDLKELIDEAHDRGIKIMVDVVLNHAGYGMHPNETINVKNFPTAEEKAKFEGMFRERGTTDTIKGEQSGLPDFMTEVPEVRAKLIEWQTSWLEKAKTEKGNTIDYFRVDTTKHVESTTWNAFKNRLTEIKPDFKMIGENYGASIDSHGGQLRSGQFDALLDFSFNDIAKDFVNGNIDRAIERILEREKLMDSTATVGNFLSSHDEDGFLWTLDKEGNNNGVYDKDEIGKFMLAVSLQLTSKGQPVIYYGEELGASGKKSGNMQAGEFSENRYDMPWERVEDENYKYILNHYKSLLSVRDKYSKVFAKGESVKLAGGDKDKFVIISKTYKDTELIVAFNQEAEESDITFKTGLEPGTVIVDEYSGDTYTVDKDGNCTFTLPSIEDGGTSLLAVKSSNDNDEDEDTIDDNDDEKENGEKDDNNGSKGRDGNNQGGKIDGENFDKLPKTGGMPIYDLIGIGVLLIACGSLIIKKKAKKV
ncbi:MAG: hypothetical protein GX206_04770 [Clostridiales bacterium]|nr:hypothetical protein [Clostridiales bacterium]